MPHEDQQRNDFEHRLLDALEEEEQRLLNALFNVRQVIDRIRRARYEARYGTPTKGQA